jgi:exonuclease SbcC
MRSIVRGFLLSTTLLMGVSFASDEQTTRDGAATSAAEAVEVSAAEAEFLTAMEAFNKHKLSTADAIVRFMTRDMRIGADTLGVTGASKIGAILKALSANIKTLVAERDALNEQVVATRAKAAEDHTAAERELAELRERLDVVTRAKEEAAGELATANKRVGELEAAVAAAERTVHETDERTAAARDELTRELETAREQARALEPRVEALLRENALLQAERRRLEEQKAALVRATAAAVNAEADEIDTL